MATLLGLALRLNDLGRIGLGSDEGHSAWMAERPLAELPGLLAVDSAPPLYYVILHGWQLWFPSDTGLRWLSVLLGTAAVPVLYLIGRRLAGTAAGVAAAFFMAVSNFHIQYSQMVKTYALTFLLAQIALLALLAACERPSRSGAWVLFGAASAGVAYAHSVGPIIVVGLSCYGLLLLGWDLRHRWKPFALAHLLMAGLYAPWLLVAIPQARAVVGGFWAPVPTLMSPLQTTARFLVLSPFVPDAPRPLIPEARPGLTALPFMQGAIDNERGRTVWVLLPALALLGGVGVAAAEPPLRRVLKLLAMVVVPVGILLAVSRLIGSVYLNRTLIPCLSVFVLFLALPFAARGRLGGAAPPGSNSAPQSVGWLRQVARGVSAAAFVLMLATGYHFAEVRQLPSWREAAAAVNAGARTGEAIVYDAHVGQVTMERYLTGEGASLPAYGLPSGWYEGGAPTAGKWVRSESDLAPLKAAAASHPAIWFVRSHTTVHDEADLGRRWCLDHLEKSAETRVVGIEVYRFESRSGASR